VIDQYLAQLPEPTRAALEKLRETIRTAAPTATETISYRLAAFRHEGMLVAFGAAANHCGFYVMSGTVLRGFRDELADYKTSKGAPSVSRPIGRCPARWSRESYAPASRRTAQDRCNERSVVRPARSRLRNDVRVDGGGIRDRSGSRPCAAANDWRLWCLRKWSFTGADCATAKLRAWPRSPNMIMLRRQRSQV
jgi:hypothetical protein